MLWEMFHNDHVFFQIPSVTKKQWLNTERDLLHRQMPLTVKLTVLFSGVIPPNLCHFKNNIRQLSLDCGVFINLPVKH